jgi:hypothetical protein
MRRSFTVVAVVALGLVGSVLGVATVGWTAPGADKVGKPIGPRMGEDLGVGEYLLAVVGGVYATPEEAQAASDAMALGELQGYYVVPVEQFEGLGAQLGVPTGFALVSVFRSDEGAEEFATFMRGVGAPATVLAERVMSFGGVYAGLGQEPNPQGTGALLGPIPDSLRAPEPAP